MGLLSAVAAVLFFLVIAITISTFLHHQLTKREFRRYPPDGQIYDADGTRMHLLTVGSGPVTVVMEAGLNGTHLEWSKVQPFVAQHTRVCTYDRVGLGYSEPGTVAIDTEAVAHRLRQLLKQAGISGPFVLVGHSYGGLHARTFARLYPSEVAGVVLVDSVHESQLRYFPEEAVRSPWILDALFRCGPLLSRIGLYRLLNLPGLLAGNLNLPADTRLRAKILMQPSATWRAMLAEYRMSRIETNQDAIAPLPPHLALTVITQGKGAGSDLQHVSPTVAAEVSRTWLELQKRLASLSDTSRHIVAGGSSHYVQLDDPECVISCILDMLESFSEHMTGLPRSTVSDSQQNSTSG